MVVAAGGQPASATAQPAAPAIDQAAAVLERTAFLMANDLDLPPRRVRGALRRLFRAPREGTLTLDGAERRLEEWIAAGS